MKTVVVVVEGRDGGRRVYTLVRGETKVSGYVVMFQGQEYAKFFLLEYQREDSGHWHRYRDRNAEEVFKGNENTYLAELRTVSPPIIAKRIRFIPYSQHPRTVCMRVEMYGCEWKDGTVSYDMPQGDKRGSEVDLYDFTYDGLVKDDYLSGGLGQLTDGDYGDTNFRLDTKKMGVKGYEWVGWKNDSNRMEPISLVFKFDTVRNFSKVVIHSNNHHTKEVRVFRRAELYFSIGGKYYQDAPIKFSYQQDSYFENARLVVIRMYNKIGRYVRIDLYFESRWIMISEAEFESEEAVGNFTEETPPPTTITPLSATQRDKQDVAVEFDISQNGAGGAAVNRDPSLSQPDPSKSINPTSENLDKKAQKPKIELTNLDRTSRAPTDGSTDSVHKEKENKEYSDDYIGIIIGALAALIVLLVCIIVIFFVRHKRRKHNNNRRSLKPVVDRHVTINLNDLRGSTNGKISNGNMYNSIATEELDSDREPSNHSGNQKLGKAGYVTPKDTIQGRHLPPYPTNSFFLFFFPSLFLPSSSWAGMRDYAVPDVTKSALVVNLPPRPPRSTNPLDKPPPNYDALYAAADIVNAPASNIPSLQGVSGNNVYAVPNADLLLSIDYSVMEFPRENLRFVEVLGEGQFGEVHLCEAIRINEFLTEEYTMNRTMSRSTMLVAVKMLRPTADDRARADFHKEIKIMSQLKDPNIVRVIGVCTQEEPLCMIVEYMKYGDLNQFLIDHVPESPVAQATNAKTLSYGCLIFMASQIASGMKYLESLNMVHRDLATRNCLVGHHFCIKISDFGMSRSLYSADYYRIEGRAGKFTTKSDVWSFAVTLWEVLTFARDQPFDGLTDEQVIENAGHYYRDDNHQVVLPCPPACPKEIYDLMRECWNRQESERPSFREIHMFLQRKNMGYNPQDEKLSQIQVPIC
ncbi:hypothetical protein C0Q70_17518 [Pomacea canaliculata]|uniref:Protein kinase domain-containing protein n=1 Tax=Pomacea canaliculata TaxID=400727 RepID=A0A2T7NKM1_POMCA|nr:hypothetical protein C0Q70_17518 [Pomacea canaliculata]